MNRPITLAMESEKIERPYRDDSNGGYQKPNLVIKKLPEMTTFTKNNGLVRFPDREYVSEYRERKSHYQDQIVKKSPSKDLSIYLIKETDPIQSSATKSAPSPIAQTT